MSSVQADPAPATPAPAIQYVPIMYDPARRRRRRARAKGGTTTIGGKRVYRGPRGGMAWVGPSALRYDPMPVLDPARRRRRARKLDPLRIGRIGTKGLVDSAIDGAGFAYIAGKIPLTGSVGPLSYQDAVAVGGSFLYEWLFMKRGLLGGAVAAAVAYALRRWLP